MGTSSASTNLPHPPLLRPRANWRSSALRGRMPASSLCHSSPGARRTVRGTASILLAFFPRTKFCAGTLVPTPGRRLLGLSCAATVRGPGHIVTVCTYPAAALAHKTAKTAFRSRGPFPLSMRLPSAKIIRASRHPQHHRRLPKGLLAHMTGRANPAAASRARSMGPARAGNRVPIRMTSWVRSRVGRGMRVW